MITNAQKTPRELVTKLAILKQHLERKRAYFDSLTALLEQNSIYLERLDLQAQISQLTDRRDVIVHALERRAEQHYNATGERELCPGVAISDDFYNAVSIAPDLTLYLPDLDVQGDEGMVGAR